MQVCIITFPVKEEMANAVYEKISRDFTKLVLSPLASDHNFPTKIKNMLEGINLFSINGQRSCPLDVFAIGSTKDISIQQRMRHSIERLAR